MAAAPVLTMKLDKMEQFAAIDLGSNSFHLVVVQDEFGERIRIGDGDAGDDGASGGDVGDQCEGNDDCASNSCIFFGDAVHVENTVRDLKPSGRRRGRVTWHRQLVNQAKQ